VKSGVPRLVLVAARAAFSTDADWLAALARCATAFGRAEVPGTAVQVRIEDAALATNERATAALACVRDAAPHVPVLLNAPSLDFAGLGFDGVHWRESAIPSNAPASSCFAMASVHSIAALHRAEAAGAHAVLYGPIWSPTWKPAQPVGLEALADITRAARVPVLAIGGITPARVAECLAAGAHGIAIASGLFTAADPAAAFNAFTTELLS
jgi:thiamine monophosphate synthase